MWDDYLFEVFYDTIGGKGPTGADIGGSGANWGEEIGVVDWIVDAPDTDVEDDAAEILDICLYNLLYKYHISFCIVWLYYVNLTYQVTSVEVVEVLPHYCHFQILRSYLMEGVEAHFVRRIINCLDSKYELVVLESEDAVDHPLVHLTGFLVLLGHSYVPDEGKYQMVQDVEGY